MFVKAISSKFRDSMEKMNDSRYEPVQWQDDNRVWVHQQVIINPEIKQLKQQTEKKYKQWLHKQVQKKSKIGKKYRSFRKFKHWHFRTQNHLNFSVSSPKTVEFLSEFLDKFYSETYKCAEGTTQTDFVEIGRITDPTHPAVQLQQTYPPERDLRQTTDIGQIPDPAVQPTDPALKQTYPDPEVEETYPDPEVPETYPDPEVPETYPDPAERDLRQTTDTTNISSVYGLFAKKDIPPFTVLCEYCGEVIPKKQLYNETTCRTIISTHNIEMTGSVDGQQKWGNRADQVLLSDLHGYLNEAMFINDCRSCYVDCLSKNIGSCTLSEEPNVHAIEILVNGWPHIFVISGPNTISKHSELLMDYGENHWDEMKQQFKMYQEIMQLENQIQFYKSNHEYVKIEQNKTEHNKT